MYSFVTGDYSGYIYALDRLSGDVMWTHRTGDQVKSSPRLTNQGLVCVGSHDQYIHLLNVEVRTCFCKLRKYASPAGECSK